MAVASPITGATSGRGGELGFKLFSAEVGSLNRTLVGGPAPSTQGYKCHSEDEASERSPVTLPAGVLQAFVSDRVGLVGVEERWP